MPFAGLSYIEIIVFVLGCHKEPIASRGTRWIFDHLVLAPVIRGFGYAQPDAGNARADSRFSSSRRALA
jgi:hypothetical protein